MSDPGDQNHRSEACPAVETLRAFAAGLLTVNNLGTVIDHLYVRTCQRCSELLLAFPETTASVLSPPPILHGPDEVPTVAAARQGSTWVAGSIESFQGLRLGRYTIRALVGKGGFGAVYAAFDEELHREVAVKVPFECGLGREELAKVTAEARLHASLDHPNIVPIYDVGHTPDIPVYWVSKLVLGQNLARRIEKSRLTAREAVLLVLQVADALEHMRLRGLVHLDIKPRNILLDMHGTPFLTDFGLAMKPTILAEGAPEDLQFAGTLPYMSPEQARGEISRVDHRSDVYSLGVVLYELLTASRPFQGDATTVREGILNRPPTAPRELDPTIPAELEAVCLKSLAKSPEQRYQEARQMADDLRLWLHGSQPLGRRSLVGITCVGILTLLGLGWVSTRPTPQSEEPDTRVPATVRTDPPGSKVSYFPLHPKTGEPQPDKVVRGKEGEVVRLQPGYYLVVTVSGTNPQQFHEVFRVVPAESPRPTAMFRHEKSTFVDGVVVLHPVKLPPEDVWRGMALFPASKAFETAAPFHNPEGDGGWGHAGQTRYVPSFYLDTTELTEEKYLEWQNASVAKKAVPKKPGHPAVGMTWNHAAAYAEWAGKRLPDEFEYEYAASAGGKWRFPWGNGLEPLKARKWPFGPAGQPDFDRVIVGHLSVYGLYSNVAEWTSSWGYLGKATPNDVNPADFRVVRGGPASILEGSEDLQGEPIGVRERTVQPGRVHTWIPRPGLGFRCARSERPRLATKDFGATLGP